MLVVAAEVDRIHVEAIHRYVLIEQITHLLLQPLLLSPQVHAPHQQHRHYHEPCSRHHDKLIESLYCCSNITAFTHTITRMILFITRIQSSLQASLSLITIIFLLLFILTSVTNLPMNRAMNIQKAVGDMNIELLDMMV